MPTLAEIEREVAPRAGPYSQHVVTAGTTLTCTVPTLQSSIALGGVENMFLLRRGKLSNGDPVPDFQATDRQRLVKTWTPSSGTLEVDRAWSGAPVEGEVIELHHLDPAAELRPAVQAGLWRCYRVDRVEVTLGGTASERDLTAAAPWITDPSQVYEVEWACVGTLALPSKVAWFRPFLKSGHVWLQVWPDPWPNALLVTARRPVATWVNAGGGYANSTTGPTEDDHAVDVDLRYAAAAAHVELWRRCRHRLLSGAQQGLFPTQQETAQEFTRIAAACFRPPARRTTFRPFGLWRLQRP